MAEHKILINRTVNCIKNIKHGLIEIEQTYLYNDLLILKHIVPSLPPHIIRCLLSELKPHRSEKLSCVKLAINFDRINVILREVERPTQLLIDFLACAGLAPRNSV